MFQPSYYIEVHDTNSIAWVRVAVERSVVAGKKRLASEAKKFAKANNPVKLRLRHKEEIIKLA